MKANMELWQHWEWVYFTESNDPSAIDAILVNMGEAKQK